MVGRQVYLPGADTCSSHSDFPSLGEQTCRGGGRSRDRQNKHHARGGQERGHTHTHRAEGENVAAGRKCSTILRLTHTGPRVHTHTQAPESTQGPESTHILVRTCREIDQTHTKYSLPHTDTQLSPKHSTHTLNPSCGKKKTLAWETCSLVAMHSNGSQPFKPNLLDTRITCNY